jgi:hypothetical protein
MAGKGWTKQQRVKFRASMAKRAAKRAAAAESKGMKKTAARSKGKAARTHPDIMVLEGGRLVPYTLQETTVQAYVRRGR